MENKEFNPAVIALCDFLKAHAGQTFTFRDWADGAGVKAATGYLRGVKEILGDALIKGEAEMPTTKIVGGYSYNLNEDYKPSEKSNPSENSKAVADWFRANEGKSVTLEQLSAELGFKVLSGHLSGARAILGKANITRTDVEVPTTEIKSVYSYNA